MYKHRHKKSVDIKCGYVGKYVNMKGRDTDWQKEKVWTKIHKREIYLDQVFILIYIYIDILLHFTNFNLLYKCYVDVQIQKVWIKKILTRENVDKNFVGQNMWMREFCACELCRTSNCV